MSTEGVCKIVKALIQHPKIVCLDVGDCDIGDKALKYICELLPADGSKPGRISHQSTFSTTFKKITSFSWFTSFITEISDL